MQYTQSQYSLAEERVHAVSHGAGLLLSIAGLLWMLDLSIAAADSWRIIASSIYGASLIALFLSSTVYHGLHASPHKPLFKLLDHCAIYLLIAGTSTPFLIVAMRSDTGWWLFGGMWALAAAGVVIKLWHGHRYPRLSLAGYLLMGWLLVIVAPEMMDAIGVNGMVWLVAGGLCYSVGAVFYAAKKLYFHHVVWHFFVLAGAACHFLAVVWYVLPV
ncbi:MAG: hemolysin III family protein [Proteobacteria bacterium]|nr:hemolysin III family protein [Pseudomonadota bacterium]